MAKYLLIPDSFKGTMSSRQVCGIMERAIRRQEPDAQIEALPIADGGEGSVDLFLFALGGEKITMTCTGPDGEPVEGFFGLLPDGTAVVEMAAAAGLTLTEEHNPAESTTYGVGELIRSAAEHGAARIVLCLGGSATNDGGCGAAAACGVRFLNAAGEVFVPMGGTLQEIAQIDASGLEERLLDLPFTAMCDIDNPLCGPQGAAAVFGPQKGADPEMVELLDEGLAHLAEIIRRDCGIEVLELPGGGAAGGMGAGAAAFFGAELKRGIDVVLDTVEFERRLSGCGLVLTGEGRLDTQSLRGKAVIGVARRAKRAGVPVAAVVGDVGDDVQDAAFEEGVSGIFSINRTAVPYEQARLRAAEDLELTVENLIRFRRAPQ